MDRCGQGIRCDGGLADIQKESPLNLGVGGFCVPLGADWDSADLTCSLRLGGWIGNRIDPAMPWADASVAALRDWLQQHGAPCLGVVPCLPEPCPAAVAAHLDDAALRAVVA